MSRTNLFRRISTACAASQQPGPVSAPQADIFDGIMKAAQRDRAALYPVQPDPLMDEVASRLVDRMEDCTRTFPRALIVGGAGIQMLAALQGRAGVESAVVLDSSPGMLERARTTWASLPQKNASFQAEFVLSDASQEILPVEPASFDAVISCLGLHWVNDVPGVMAQCRHALRPDGLFLGAMLGGTTLQELRIACTLAQQEREGGVSPRTSPLVQVRDAGNLLTRAGLSIPTVDVDDIAVHYSDVVGLVRHLREMAENSALVQRRESLPRDSALAAAAAYATLFQEEEGADESGGADGCSIPATFQVVYMTGWAPDTSQQRPAKRGSATVSFSDLSKEFANNNAEK